MIAQQAIQSEVYEIQQDFQSYSYTQKIITMDDDNMIAFSKTNLQNEPYIFYYIRVGSSNVRAAELNPDFEVKDMVLLKDTIFFCGQFAQHLGFIARAKVSDLFSNTFEYDVIPDFGSIDKLEAFYRSGDSARQIAAIGTKYNSNFSYLLHSDEAIGWQCDIFYDNTAIPETLDDIELNTKEIVTVGRKSNQSGTAIILTIYDKDNFYVPPPFIIMEGYFVFALNKLHAKNTEDELLAVSGTFTDVNTSQTGTLNIVADMQSISITQRQYFDGYNNIDID
ncbi:MAG: hypothetical protein LBR17_01340 [Bacteroidales bacterium]|jgi:hypothetical protein|nr:hypothetical protein [Bacteroidales bacterium]